MKFRFECGEQRFQGGVELDPAVKGALLTRGRAEHAVDHRTVGRSFKDELAISWGLHAG
jgi:hypothetical protein